MQNLSEITDSREMLEAKPHRFTSIFSYGLIAILVITLIWSYFSEIDIVVKMNGVVKSNDKTITVINEVASKVDKVYFEEGKTVKEGDILYTLECKEAILSKDNYEKQLRNLQIDTDNIKKFKKSILENKNYFDANNTDEADYYYKYLQYIMNNENLYSSEHVDTNDIKKYKIDILVKLNDSIRENEQKIGELKTTIENIQYDIDKCTVKAIINGVVNVKSDIAKGQIVQSGQEILSVIPQDNSQYKVQLYVSNKDILGMRIGEKIKYHFEALPYEEYGELTGIITNIAEDAIIDQKSGLSYYLVQSEIQNKPLFSYKGEKGEIKIGMNCEAQVVTERKKILYYLLEKINLIK